MEIKRTAMHLLLYNGILVASVYICCDSAGDAQVPGTMRYRSTLYVPINMLVPVGRLDQADVRLVREQQTTNDESLTHRPPTGGISARRRLVSHTDSIELANSRRSRSTGSIGCSPQHATRSGLRSGSPTTDSLRDEPSSSRTSGVPFQSIPSDHQSLPHYPITRTSRSNQHLQHRDSMELAKTTRSRSLTSIGNTGILRQHAEIGDVLGAQRLILSRLSRRAAMPSTSTQHDSRYQTRGRFQHDRVPLIHPHFTHQTNPIIPQRLTEQGYVARRSSRGVASIDQQSQFKYTESFETQAPRHPTSNLDANIPFEQRFELFETKPSVAHRRQPPTDQHHNPHVGNGRQDRQEHVYLTASLSRGAPPIDDRQQSQEQYNAQSAYAHGINCLACDSHAIDPVAQFHCTAQSEVNFSHRQQLQTYANRNRRFSTNDDTLQGQAAQTYHATRGSSSVASVRNSFGTQTPSHPASRLYARLPVGQHYNRFQTEPSITHRRQSLTGPDRKDALPNRREHAYQTSGMSRSTAAIGDRQQSQERYAGSADDQGRPCLTCDSHRIETGRFHRKAQTEAHFSDHQQRQTRVNRRRSEPIYDTLQVPAVQTHQAARGSKDVVYLDHCEQPRWQHESRGDGSRRRRRSPDLRSYVQVEHQYGRPLTQHILSNRQTLTANSHFSRRADVTRYGETEQTYPPASSTIHAVPVENYGHLQLQHNQPQTQPILPNRQTLTANSHFPRRADVTRYGEAEQTYPPASSTIHAVPVDNHGHLQLQHNQFTNVQSQRRGNMNLRSTVPAAQHYSTNHATQELPLCDTSVCENGIQDQGNVVPHGSAAHRLQAQRRPPRRCFSFGACFGDDSPSEGVTLVAARTIREAPIGSEQQLQQERGSKSAGNDAHTHAGVRTDGNKTVVTRAEDHRLANGALRTSMHRVSNQSNSRQLDTSVSPTFRRHVEE